MRFLVIELDGIMLDRVQHRVGGFLGRRAAQAREPAPPVRPPRRWLRSRENRPGPDRQGMEFLDS